MGKQSDPIRGKILDLVKAYYQLEFANKQFVPGETLIPASGKVFDEEELINLVDSALDFWLTAGRFAQEFEREFARFFNMRYAILTNSGSSANLLALSALTSPKLKDRRLKPGDEVITVATGFPTTVNPIIQSGLIPVFLDIELGSYNIDVAHLEEAISKKTRAIILAHTLGNPFNVDRVLEVVHKYNLYLIEDICDAVGARYNGQLVGTFGDLATVSFYPAHHITMGEGGGVLTNRLLLKQIVRSFRDWGRDCWCDPGKDNTCGKRFGWQLGDLPYGYDHKYIYSHIGYNLKATDMQAAVGLAQLKKLPKFIEARRRNFQLLYGGLKPYEEYFILPESLPEAKPSWFGFPLTIRENAGFTRRELVTYLEDNHIATRMLFGGNLVRQPPYSEVTYRQVGDLKNADFVMNNTFWIGLYPGITEGMIDFVIRHIGDFVKKGTR